jgi:hypothetical protein
MILLLAQPYTRFPPLPVRTQKPPRLNILCMLCGKQTGQLHPFPVPSLPQSKPTVTCIPSLKALLYLFCSRKTSRIFFSPLHHSCGIDQPLRTAYLHNSYFKISRRAVSVKCATSSPSFPRRVGFGERTIPRLDNLPHSLRGESETTHPASSFHRSARPRTQRTQRRLPRRKQRPSFHHSAPRF